MYKTPVLEVCICMSLTNVNFEQLTAIWVQCIAVQ